MSGEIQDIFNNLGNTGTVPDIGDIISSGKKKKRSSIFGEQEQQFVKTVPAKEIIPQQIVVPQSLQEQIVQQTIEKQQQEKQEVVVMEQAKLAIQSLPSVIQKAPDEPIPEETVQKIKETVEFVKEEPLPENIDVVKVTTDTVEALAETSDGESFDIKDVEIIASPDKKDKSGYYKTKVNIKKENIPQQINIIASYVKRASKGIISPRVCDLRVIGNTNKTQLRGSDLKLSTATIVFKPDAKKLKVNRGTRFMLSIPENYSETGNLLIYIQESRAKTIMEVSPKDFPNVSTFNEFIGDRIAEYYTLGYESVMRKLELRGANNPLMSILTQVVKTRLYKGKPYVNSKHVYQIEFISTGEKNQWLSAKVTETDFEGTYDVTLHNSVDQEWNYKVNKKPISYNKLESNILQVFNEAFNKDWVLNKNIDNIYYQYDKLSHNKLKNALLTVNDLMTEKPERGIEIKKVFSKKDTTQFINGEYDAEAVIGKTLHLDHFILTYLAFQIVGGDDRKGQEYITTDEYYEKYGVKDKRAYQEREKTILKKEGEKRNYNARPYVFQLEYSLNGKSHIYRTKTWADLVEATGFLSEDVKFPVTKF